MLDKKFYFIRHGETDWNRHNHYQGHTDVPINERGREQAREMRLAISQLDIDGFFSSSLQRAKETAQILAGEHEVETIDSLKECGCPNVSARIYHDLGLSIPDFSRATVTIQESREEFLRRSVEGVAQALKKSNGAPLIVAHGGTYWALCRHLGHVPSKIPNCTPVLFEPTSKGWRIEALETAVLV